MIYFDRHPAHSSAVETLVRNLQLLMRQHGLSEAELSRQTKIPQPTLHKILTGKTEDPRISTLQVLASYFNISLDQLCNGNLSLLSQSDAHPNTQSIPVIAWRDCANSMELTKTLSPSNWEHWLVIEYVTGNAYALQSKSSMEPRFPKGTLFVVHPNLTPEDGDLIIVQYADTQESTIREFSCDGPSQFLIPINVNATKDPLSSEIKIFGVVVQSRFSYA